MKQRRRSARFYLPALFMRLAEGGDLLFHVQERCYTLLQLSENIQELSLLFFGFCFPRRPGVIGNALAMIWPQQPR
jgi:hypothetical protein